MDPAGPASQPPSGRTGLAQELAREEARLRQLESERREQSSRVERLRALIAGLGAPRLLQAELPVLCCVPASAAPATPAEKVALFRSLFRGRADVYPRLWVSPRTGKKGYSPACSNEWVRGVCEKPRVKCGECPSQAFPPVTDQVILDHLQGRHVVGVYPLLEDEACWLLAADFDRESWQDDVAAFRAACDDAEVPAYVERSRSGNGAHVWLFFASPVPASLARKLGSHLLTRAMERRHQLGMASYDRLFPNQDTLPRGGFGNLIALPLQHGPRQEGNTVFLDESFAPCPDQWALLASVRRLERGFVERLVEDARSKGQILDVRFPDSGGDIDLDPEESAAPWKRRPSGRRQEAPIAEGVLPEVRAVLAQRLFVEKAGLPSALLNRIQRLAAFQNPEFYKRQKLRLSTALTPRVISCAEELPQHLAIPRGCRPDLEALLGECGSRLLCEDQREDGVPVQARFQGMLTPLQERAAKALLEHETGLLVAPPGMGKTVLGACMIARRARSALVLVHRRPLMEQWIAQLALFLGLEPREIGRIGGGKHAPAGRIDVAMLQSLVSGVKVSDLVAAYGHVIVDECHHVPAASFERVLSEVKARYLLGLTATPRRRDGHHPILEMQLGPVRFEATGRSQAAACPFAHRLIVRETRFRWPGAEEPRSIQDLYRALAADADRNRLVIDDAIAAVDEGRSPIVLTERRDHLERLASALRRAVRHVVVLSGGLSAKERRRAAEELAAIPPGEERLLVATGRYIGEGFDDARLDTLLLALPISWKGTLVQYAGRLHRQRAGKTEVRIYDYLDREVPVLERMFERRLRGYRAMGYAAVEP
ncbi:MAG: DEAD/DEAH box helicase family protein [Planctomycetes bacterium]|nr:DEAD/DEAH box helicase family protein [Planctomycetota bacterium]